MALGDLQPEEDEEEGEEDPVEVESKVVEENDESSKHPTPVGPETPENSLIQPVDDAQEIANLYEKFEDLKTTLLKSSDLQKIKGNQFVTKSGWRKMATAFNLSLETLEEKREEIDGVVIYTVKAKATAPNGKSATGLGKCSSNESNHMEYVADGDVDLTDSQLEDGNIFKIDGKYRRLKEPREVNEHNLFTMAETRAKNRAISDCVGGGEVSAEEIGKEQVLN